MALRQQIRRTRLTSFFLAPGSISDAKPLAIVEAAARAGYSGVGMSLQKRLNRPLDPVVGDQPLIRAIKALLRESGMEVLDILAFFLRPETEIGEFAPSLELGAELGAKYALTQGDDADWHRLCDRFESFCNLATSVGLTPIVEFMPARSLATLSQTLDLLRDTGRTNIPILIDPLHLVRSEGDASELSRIDPKLFPYAQMTDGILAPGEPNLEIAKRLGAGDRRLPGEGNLPLREIFDALPANIPISVEVSHSRSKDISADQWAKTALIKTKAFFAEAV
jgi:sugar phosphate isomerase/epimerase